MTPPHFNYQAYISLFEPKCGELSEYTDSAHNEVEELSAKCVNGSNVYDPCQHDENNLFVLAKVWSSHKLDGNMSSFNKRE